MSRRTATAFALLALALTAAAAAPPAPPAPGTAWERALQGAGAAELESAFAAEVEAGHSDALGAWALAQARLARGERALAAVAAVEGLRTDPGHPAAFLLEALLTEEAFFDATTTRLVADSLPGIVAHPDLEPSVRFNLRWLAYRIAARSGDAGDRDAARAASGFPDRGLFAVAQGPRSRLDFVSPPALKGARPEGLEWSPSRWDIPLSRPPLYALSEERESVVWTALPFESDRGGEALLYVNAGTSVRVFLDGRPVMARDYFRRQENPTSLVRLRLEAGRHLLLAQVFAARSGDGVHLALLDPAGGPWGARWSDDPSALDWAGTSQVVGELPLRFQSGFPAADPRRAALEALFHGWLGDSARSRLDLERAAKAQPRCLLWRLLVVEAYLFRADDLPSPVAQGRAESAVEAVVTVDPSCALARYYQALVRQAATDSDEDLPVLKALLDQSPGDPRWGLRLASRYQQKGWSAEARQVLLRVRDDHPESEAVESAWVGFAGAAGDRAAQADAIARLGRLRRADPEREDFLQTTLQFDALSRLLEEEAALFGDRDLQFARRQGRLAARVGDFARAERIFGDILQKAPRDEEAAFAVARLHALQGRTEEARARWDALKRDRPRLFQIDLARWLSGEPLPFEDRRLTLAQVLAEDRTDGPDQAPSSFLLDQQFTRVEEDGSSLERYHGVIRVNDKEGVDREGEQSLRGQLVLAVRTVKPDGRSLEPEQIPEKSTLSMPGLEPGDLIEYETITFLPPNEIEDRSYITAQVFLFQDLEKPFHRTQWYLEHPSAMPFRYFEQNLPHGAEAGEAGGRTFRNWEFRAMPRIAPEPDTPYKTAFTPLAEAVGGVSWEDIGYFLKNRMVGAFQVTPEVEAAAREAVAGATGPEARAAAIVRYLLKEVDGEEGGQWGDPTETLLTRRGSRIPLACALFEASGVPYRLLLAEPVVNRVERQDLPRIGQFTVPVLEVGAVGGGKRYLTLESPHRAPSVLPWYLHGARALPVTGPGPGTPEVIPADLAPWREALEEEGRLLGADGSLEVTHRQRLDPDGSESLRSTLQRVPKDQHDRVIQMALSRQFGNAEVTHYAFEGLEDADRPLVWDYRLRVDSYATVSEGRLTVPEPLPPLHLSQALASLTERSLPLSTGGFLRLHQRYRLTLPKGATTDFRPASVSLSGPFGTYVLKGEMKGGVITFDRTVEIPYQVVAPAKYAAFRAFVGQIDAAESGQLVLQLPVGGAR